MTLYRGFFYKDKERKKSGPTKNCRYSEFDVIRSVVIRSLNCTMFIILNLPSLENSLLVVVVNVSVKRVANVNTILKMLFQAE